MTKHFRILENEKKKKRKKEFDVDSICGFQRIRIKERPTTQPLSPITLDYNLIMHKHSVRQSLCFIYFLRS